MKRISSLSPTARIMCASLGGLFLAVLLVGLIIAGLVYPFEAPLPFALGLLAGTLLSMWKVILMESSIAKVVDMEGKASQTYASFFAMLRYILTAVVLVCAFLFKTVIGPFGAVIGVLNLQIAAYITGWLLRKDTPPQTDEP